ncbi:MAG: NADH-quinone oxidoreductase subunit N [Acidobacteria bacterium]|nr:NADH-quinone oxidoreductase subunit N [Acidobacteriota bacterium]
MSFESLTAIAPILCVTAAGVASMLAEALRSKGERLPIAGLGVIGLAGSGVTAMLLWNRGAESFDVVKADNFSLFVTLVLTVIGLLTLMYSPRIVERDDLPEGEYYALTLFALAGMMLMAMATDLVILFLALEVFSLAVYVLTGIRRDSAAGTEGAFKYFLLGSFSSAFFVYGIAFTYGLTGTTRLDRISMFLAADGGAPSPLVMVALGLLIVSFAFKVSAVPFHMWTPDAYEGAPAIVAGFMSTAVKAAAFAAFLRVVVSGFGPLVADWAVVLWWVSAATMIVGTVVAVVQTNLKRMLAYSSIAHAGYLLIGLVAANGTGGAALLFYLLVYAVANLGAFAVIALLATRQRANDEIAEYTGLWHRQPAMATVLTVFLLSLGGMPPLAGFVGKWYVFSAAVRSGYYGLAIIGVLTSVVAVFFYLRIVVAMFMSEAEGGIERTAQPRVAVAALALSVAVTFYLGILPARVLDLAAASIATLF